MKYVDLAVRLDAAAARTHALTELEGRGFRVTWPDEWTAVAEKGSKVANVLLGALAQYFKFGVRVMAEDSGVTIVRFEKLASGWLGGYLGSRRADNQLKSLRDDLARAFDASGLLAGVTEG